LRYSISEGWRAIWPIWWTTSKSVKTLIGQERAHRYLHKYLKYARDYEEPQAGETTPRIIWICWLQGMEAAPETVQLCYRSVQKWAKDFEIRIITEENMLDNVTLPEKVVKKYRKGSIPFAQFSDIVRVSLLAEHGGIWMDATVAMTGEMPTYVTDTPLFMFRGSWLQPGRTMASNWFLASTKGHPVMQNMKELLLQYWQHESFLRDYYIFHILLYILAHEHPQTRRLVNAMPYVQNADVHSMMYRAATEEYSDALKKDILRASTIHKLSYKNDIDYHLYIQ